VLRGAIPFTASSDPPTIPHFNMTGEASPGMRSEAKKAMDVVDSDGLEDVAPNDRSRMHEPSFQDEQRRGVLEEKKGSRRTRVVVPQASSWEREERESDECRDLQNSEGTRVGSLIVLVKLVI
jgi:hypothetical protein